MECTLLLLDTYHLSPNSTCNEGKDTPLQYAIGGKQKEIYTLLLSFGARDDGMYNDGVTLRTKARETWGEEVYDKMIMEGEVFASLRALESASFLLHCVTILEEYNNTASRAGAAHDCDDDFILKRAGNGILNFKEMISVDIIPLAFQMSIMSIH